VHVSGTIYNGAALLHAEGAREVYACCTHAVFRYVLILNLTCFLSLTSARRSTRQLHLLGSFNYRRFLYPLDIVPCDCSPPAIERLSGGLFHEVITTNTIPLREKHYFPQLTVFSVANLLGETIWRVHEEGSVSSMLTHCTSLGAISLVNDCF